MLQISDNHKIILKDGKPYFYLADTCWSAFTNITDEEWDYYLYKRKAQGFNTLQINILPQWDASQTDLNYSPFIEGDPFKLNDEYFNHAKEMCKKAKEQGFELALVVLWCNYVPNTWASNMLPKYILPFDCLENYVNKVNETFTEFNPIYVISGDTDFMTEETIKYYVHVGTILKGLAKDCLFTSHIKGRYTEIPDDLYKLMDILFYQSGHNAQDLSMPYSLAEEMIKKYPGKPLINSEPCYENMGYSRKMYGRWTRRDIRRAAYVSILAGASAGITYGASGIYDWQKTAKSHMTALGEGFDRPKCVEECMAFQGAWDYGYLKTLFESLEITNLEPAQDLLINNTSEIRIAKVKEDMYMAYVPYNTCVRLDKDFTGCTIKAVDLSNRFVADMTFSVKEGKTAIDLHPFDEDVLYIISC
jgi:hypothetical protein